MRNDIGNRNIFSKISKIILPGDEITIGKGYMRGHGTYEHEKRIYSSVCGTLEKVNKLVFVKSLQGRYEGCVGDVVIGRVEDIAYGKWFLDIGSFAYAQLPLGGLACEENRIRMDDDRTHMYDLYKPKDLLCCEVQKLHNDGSVILHIRSGKYGLLKDGCLVIVPPQQVKRHLSHVQILSCNIQLILGNNGYLWISSCLPVGTKRESNDSAHLHPLNSEQISVSRKDRLNICIIRNCIIILSFHGLDISAKAIEVLYTLTTKNQIHPADLLKSSVQCYMIQEYMDHCCEFHA